MKPMKIAVIAPAGYVDADLIHQAVNALKTYGVDCQLGRNLFHRHRYFSGTVNERLDDLIWAYRDVSIDAIWCARGGSGAAQLLPALNALVANDPNLKAMILSKPLIGYSDITALHQWINQQGGISLHGPVVQEIAHKNCLSTDLISYDAQLTLHYLNAALSSEPCYPLVAVNSHAQSAQLSGKIVGGNLAVLASLQGTSWALNLHERSILLIEDVSEPFYRLERLWVQILQSIDQRHLAAVVLGDFYQCPQYDVESSLSDIFAEHLPDNVALYQAHWFGHGTRNLPFWLGRHGQLSPNALSIC